MENEKVKEKIQNLFEQIRENKPDDLIRQLRKEILQYPQETINSLQEPFKGYEFEFNRFVSDTWSNYPETWKAYEDKFLKTVIPLIGTQELPLSLSEFFKISFYSYFNFSKLANYAESNRPILITGETGTGKELFAKVIHYSSDRWDKPFKPINCGGLPEGLIESELFGSMKGAFTGAKDKPGYFEEAGEGTVFLDEIGDMLPGTQAKVLRVLNDHKFYRVGDFKKECRLKARVICATNKDLVSLIKEEKFREDLFHRINVLTISLPSLREHLNVASLEDSEILLKMIAREIAIGKNTPVPTFSNKAIKKLVEYNYPGNYRELKNIIEKVFIEKAFIEKGGKKEITEDAIDFQPRSYSKDAEKEKDISTMTLQEVEQLKIEKIKELLSKHGGNLRKCAVEAGVSGSTPSNAGGKFKRDYCEKYGIKFRDYRKKLE